MVTNINFVASRVGARVWPQSGVDAIEHAKKDRPMRNLLDACIFTDNAVRLTARGLHGQHEPDSGGNCIKRLLTAHASITQVQ